jgi:hypothetical protein
VSAAGDVKYGRRRAKELTVRVGVVARGVGSRLSERTVIEPKPMLATGVTPIAWHIMPRSQETPLR